MEAVEGAGEALAVGLEVEAVGVGDYRSLETSEKPLVMGSSPPKVSSRRFLVTLIRYVSPLPLWRIRR